MSTQLTLTVPLLLAAIAQLGGCYRPEGALMASTGAPATYYSTSTQPKSVLVRDLRTDDIVFTMDIPVGSQLTMQFRTGDGDDPVYTPDLLKWQLFDLGTTTGKLRNSMSVPDGPSRRVEVSVRPSPEYPPQQPDRALRTDEMADRPDWWTPAGGELPDHNATIWNP